MKMLHKTYVEFSAERKPKLDKWLAKNSLTAVAQCFVYGIEDRSKINVLEIVGLDFNNFPSSNEENAVVKGGKAIGHWIAVGDKSIRNFGRLIVPVFE